MTCMTFWVFSVLRGLPGALFPLLAAAVLAGCGQTGGFSGADRVVALASSQSLSHPAGDTEFTTYRLNPGDVLELVFRYDTRKVGGFALRPLDQVQIRFLSLPDWNTTQKIRPDGSVSLPYAGEMRIAGLTVAQAAKKLEAAYADKLKDTRVFLEVQDFTPPMQETREALTSPQTGSTRLVTVQADGRVSLPLAGTARAGGVPFGNFRAEVREMYKAKLGIEADVLLNKSSGSSIYVVGAVNQPGAYTISRPTDVVQALALGHGFTNDANLDQVVLVRRRGDTMVCTPINVNAALRGQGGSGMTPLQNGDIIFVSRTRLSRAAEVAQQISNLTFFRGFNFGVSWTLNENGETNIW